MTGTVNGHPIEFSKLPAWGQSNSYLLWMLYREVVSVHARYPLNVVSIHRVPGSRPVRFDAFIDVATNGDWVMRLVMDDPLNPKFSIEESHQAAWSWGLVEATRGLRSAIVELLVANPDLIDDLSFQVS